MKTFLAVNEITDSVDYTTQSTDAENAILQLQGELREWLDDSISIFRLQEKTEKGEVRFQIYDEEFSGIYHFVEK